jgi:hypothetical protein
MLHPSPFSLVARSALFVDRKKASSLGGRMFFLIVTFSFDDGNSQS